MSSCEPCPKRIRVASQSPGNRPIVLGQVSCNPTSRVGDVTRGFEHYQWYSSSGQLFFELSSASNGLALRLGLGVLRLMYGMRCR